MKDRQTLRCAVVTLMTALSAVAAKAATVRLDLQSVEMAGRASVVPNMFGTTLAVKMTPKSRYVFANFSRLRVGEIVHIRVGSRIVSSPRLDTEITGGEILISGFTDEEDARRALVALGSRSVFVEIDGSDK